MKNIIKPYKKEYDYSYASGAYATIELLKAKPQQTRAVYIHPEFYSSEAIEALCGRYNIPVIRGAEPFRRISQKENSYVLGVFDKWEQNIDPHAAHIVLVNPGDMGNLGTVIRTMTGFGFLNLAIITPAADVWSPKTVRASMGALFHISLELFSSFEQYMARFSGHRLYPFMLNGETELSGVSPPTGLFSLVFGNEATGLDSRFKAYGSSILIQQSKLVDSLNVAIAAAIGMYVFSADNRNARPESKANEI